MSVLHGLVFCILIAVVVSQGKKTNFTSKSGREFAEHVGDDPMFTDVKQFYNENGTVKAWLSEFRPSECDRRGMTGLRPSTTLTWCPTPYLHDHWEWKCIRSEDICNSIKDCPNGEDESPTMCFQYIHQNDRLGEMEKRMKPYEELLEVTETTDEEDY